MLCLLCGEYIDLGWEEQGAAGNDNY